MTWFRAQSGTTWHPSLRIADFRDRNAGRGIIAVENIPAETDLFIIGRSVIISEATSELATKLPQLFTAQDVETQDDVEDDHDGQESTELPTAWLNLILILIYECLHRDTSKWRSYLDILPLQASSFDTLMFWSQDDLSELQASAIRSKIGKESADKMFKERIIPVIKKHADVFYSPSANHPSEEELLEQCHVIGSLIMSYAFDLQPDDEDDEGEDEEGWTEDRSKPSTMGMVPMADMLNADAEFNAHLSHGEESLTMTSLREIKAGEEVLNYYGPLPNAELLRRYGYTTSKHARHDVVEISWSLCQTVLREASVTNDSNANQRFQQMLAGVADVDGLEDVDLEEGFLLERETGDPNEQGIFTTDADFNRFPDELMQLISTMLIVVRHNTSSAKLNDSLKRTIKRETFEVLGKLIEERLSEYATTLEQDEELSVKPNAPSRQRAAFDVRRGEKKLLKEAHNFAQHMQVKYAQDTTKRTAPATSQSSKKKQRTR